MSADTCSRCQFFRLHYGQEKGFCWAMPPAVFHNGYQQGNPPEVKRARIACTLFRALPEGADTIVKTKVDPETVGDAAKQAALLKKQAVTSGKK